MHRSALQSGFPSVLHNMLQGYFQSYRSVQLHWSLHLPQSLHSEEASHKHIHNIQPAEPDARYWWSWQMRTGSLLHLTLFPALCSRTSPSHRSVRCQNYRGSQQQKYCLLSVLPSAAPVRGWLRSSDRIRWSWFLLHLQILQVQLFLYPRMLQSEWRSHSSPDSSLQK